MPATSNMGPQTYEYVETCKGKKEQMIKIPYLLKERPKQPNYPKNER